MNARGRSALRRATLVGGAAAVAGVAGWSALRLLNAPVQAPGNVEFATIDGERIALDDLRGRVVLVNFWATSCVICLAEMPQLARLHAQLAPRGLETVAVAMPFDRPDFVTHYAQRAALPFRVALDPLGKATRALGPVRGTPTLLVIDREGAIVRRIEGAFDIAQLGALIERLL